jgi:putative DNA primase/helicase
MLKDAQTVYPLSLSELDKDSNLFNCQNCTLHLDTLKFTSHSDSDNLSMMSGVSYKPGIVCLRWIQFIDEVTEGDTDKARFIQKAFGYALLGSPKEECLFILYGETTRNGKGVTMTVITRIFGDYAKTVQPETLAVKKYANGSGPTEDLARLRGARLVNINEPSKDMRLDVAKVKTMTGRDKITARFLHQGSFEFIPGFSIMINTNHLPSVDDETLFTSGRIKVISFDRHFSESEQDKSLKDTLTEPDSLSGVFNWVLEGLRLYRAEGLGNPCSVVTATAKYHLESDKEAEFMYENTQAFEGRAIRTSDLYKQYTFWCQKNNHTPLTIKSFSINLSKKGYTIKVMRWQGSDKVSHVLDTALKPQSEQNLYETNTG